MPRWLKYFAGSGVSLILAIFLFSASYSGLIYISDYVRSAGIRIFGLYEKPDVSVSIISGEGLKKYRKSFKELPEGMIHFAGMLIYRAPRNIKAHELALRTMELTDYYRL